jgi:hypothetical protein
MKRSITICAIVVLMFIVGAPTADADVVEFSEVDLPTLTLLDGTTHFDPYGLAFQDTTYYAIDSRFPLAGLDNHGITTTSGPDNIATVVFTTPAVWLTADWLTIGTNDIYMTAYDSGGNVLDAQSATGLTTDPAWGSFTFAGVGDIAKISFWDATGTVGVGRLEFTPVPIPGAVLLGMLGLGVAGWKLRRFA